VLGLAAGVLGLLVSAGSGERFDRWWRDRH
jgi:hypothetical protein